MKKLDDKGFEFYVKQLREKIEGAGLSVLEKPLNYGRQLVAESGGEKAFVNAYNGKKGLKLVLAGEKKLKDKLAGLCLGSESCDQAPACQEPEEPKREGFSPLGHAVWAGSDESGKGDFFGSLVVAAVALDEAGARKLYAAGVRDCKQVTDRKALELEPVIKDAALACSVLDLKPRFYNRRYREVVAAGGKLNQLLASGHVRALSQVLDQRSDCTYALIDQFTKELVCVKELEREYPRCRVEQMTGAEADMAVAAASCLARARFLRTLAELAQAAGEESLPKGASSATTACAARLALKYGLPFLEDYVKLHFANYARVRDGKA